MSHGGSLILLINYLCTSCPGNDTKTGSVFIIVLDCTNLFSDYFPNSLAMTCCMSEKRREKTYTQESFKIIARLGLD